jgi:predicted transcriptional regulator
VDKIPVRRKTVLLTILELYQEFKRAVQLGEIMNATSMGKEMVRRELDILKCLELIESRPGRKGGYIPRVYAHGGL